MSSCIVASLPISSSCSAFGTLNLFERLDEVLDERAEVRLGDGHARVRFLHVLAGVLARTAGRLADLIGQALLELGDVGVHEPRVDAVVLRDLLLDEVLDDGLDRVHARRADRRASSRWAARPSRSRAPASCYRRPQRRVRASGTSNEYACDRILPRPVRATCRIGSLLPLHLVRGEEPDRLEAARAPRTAARTRRPGTAGPRA